MSHKPWATTLNGIADWWDAAGAFGLQRLILDRYAQQGLCDKVATNAGREMPCATPLPCKFHPAPTSEKGTKP